MGSTLEDSAYITQSRHFPDSDADTSTVIDTTAIFDDTIREQPTEVAFPTEVEVCVRESATSHSAISTASLIGSFFGCMQPVRNAISSVKVYLNPYRIDVSSLEGGQQSRIVNQGTEGVVLTAYLSGKEIVVKDLRNFSLYNAELIEKLAKDRPANIITFLGHNPDPPFYVMEYLAGGTLGQYIKSGGGISPCQLIRWSRDIATGLEYCHRQGIIHCDIKSENLMFDAAREELKIIDFESSVQIPHGQETVSIPRSRGTTAYMCPEMVQLSNISTAVDIWSYGVVIWEMTTLQAPYREELLKYGKDAVFYGIGMENYSLHIPDDIPAGIKVLLTMCWKSDPEARPAAYFIKKHLIELEKELQQQTAESYRESQMSWRDGIPIQPYNPEQIEEWRQNVEKYRTLQRKYNDLSNKYRHLLIAYKKLSKGAEPVPPTPPTRRRSGRKKGTLFNPNNRADFYRCRSVPNIDSPAKQAESAERKASDKSGDSDSQSPCGGSDNSEQHYADVESLTEESDFSPSPATVPMPQEIADEFEEESLANFGVIS